MRKKSLSAKKKNYKIIADNLSDKRINNIFKLFENNLKKKIHVKKYGAAISGGPDSMALAYLIYRYNLANKKKCFYYHIDHQLRKNSFEEAQKVKHVLKKWNINLKVIRWLGKKPETQIQSIARLNRYNLLKKEMKKVKIKYLFLGHNQNDVIENFFIRINRGSGLRGFVSLNQVEVQVGDINLIRPLINIPKEDLVYISKKIFNFYIEDPSNTNQIFKRVRVRKIIKLMNDEGINKQKVNLTLNNLTSADEAIKFYVKENLLKNAKYFKMKNYFLLNDKFFSQPREIVLRSISFILKKIGNNLQPARGKKILSLLESLKSNDSIKLTLSGCIIEKIKNLIKICPERPKKT